jgi:hypothetical protein
MLNRVEPYTLRFSDSSTVLGLNPRVVMCGDPRLGHCKHRNMGRSAIAIPSASLAAAPGRLPWQTKAATHHPIWHHTISTSTLATSRRLLAEWRRFSEVALARG